MFKEKTLKSKIITSIMAAGTLLIILVYTSLYFINISKSNSFNKHKLTNLILVIKEDLIDLNKSQKIINRIIKVDPFIKQIKFGENIFKGNTYLTKTAFILEIDLNKKLSIYYSEDSYKEYVSALMIRMAIVALGFYFLIFLISIKISILLNPFNEIVIFFQNLDINNFHKLIYNSKNISKEFQYVETEINKLGTKINESTQKINFIAYNDELTHLPNRRAYHKEISLLFESDKLFTVLFMDLDGFKIVNDSFGHKAGDFVLENIGIRLSSFNEKVDIFRVGGDEFILIYKSIDTKLIERICQEIIYLVSQDIIYQDTILKISTSIGVSLRTEKSTEDSLLKESDIAMYEAKAAGKNQFMFFEQKMLEKIDTKNKLMIDLRKATENEEFFFEIQPQVDILTNKISGAEALIRWDYQGTGEIISPFHFIEVLEKSIYIIPVTNQIIKQVFEYAYKLNKEGIVFGRIAINLAEELLKQDYFILDIKRLLEETKCPSSLIEFEITERWVSIEKRYIQSNLDYLKDLGFTLSMDDFGEDNSSFKRTDILPIDKIKLDKNFSDRLFYEQTSEHSISTVLTYSNLTNRTFLIEGIETEKQLNKIKELGIQYVQGYYFYKPLSIKSFKKLF